MIIPTMHPTLAPEFQLCHPLGETPLLFEETCIRLEGVVVIVDAVKVELVLLMVDVANAEDVISMVLEYEIVVASTPVADIGVNKKQPVEEGEGKGVIDARRGQSIEH
jgi:hypothetical protein